MVKKRISPITRKFSYAKLFVSIAAGLVGTVLFVMLGWFVFAIYGGNSCDNPPEMTCDCFCCHMFNSRGFESCAIFGSILGGVVGFVLGFGIVFALWDRVRRT